MWYGLVEPVSGNLVSVGTISMFPDGNLDAFTGVYDVVEFGADRPDFSAKLWSSALHALIDRPLPVIVSRLDDFETWLVLDEDWLSVWNALNETRKARIRLGLRRILTRMLGDQVNRHESEAPEL